MREVIRVFYSFARISDDIADSDNLNSFKKLKILNFFDKSIRNSKKSNIDFLDQIINLYEKFPKSKNYSRELLKAFTLDAKKKRYKNWADLVSYCKYSANPVGRFFIYLTYENNFIFHNFWAGVSEFDSKIKKLSSAFNFSAPTRA